MNMLMAGLAIFILIHLVPSAPAIRSAMMTKFGDGPYKGLFSLLSLLGLVLIVLGLKSAETIALYDPPTWGRPITYLLVFIALYLVLSNSTGPMPSSAKTWTAHPMSWGVALWAVGHLLSNGDQAHVILFGAMLGYSLFTIFSGNLRGQKPALDKRPSLITELLFIVAVVVIYIGLFWGHRYFTGMPLV